MNALTISALRHSLRLVAPGQPVHVRMEGAQALVGRVRADRDHGRSLAASIRPGGRSLAVFDDRPLDPASDSASHRLAALLRMAAALGYETSFYSVRQRRWFSVSEDASLSPAEGAPASVGVAWIVRPEAASVASATLAALRPSLRVVYDSMDLHYLRLQRESAVTGSRGLRLQAKLMRRLEARAASTADVAVAITEKEAPLLGRIAGGAEVVVLPNVHEPRADDLPPPDARDGLLFMGNYTHTPNVDSAELLVREVMPRIWSSRPDVTLSLAGPGLPVDRLGTLDPRVEAVGWVDDLDALADGSLALVAPLRFGAGLKGKIGFALSRGLPVVTTPVGAEGFAEQEGMLVSPNGDWDGFAARVVELVADKELWSRTSRAGIELTWREYSPAALRERFRRILEP